MHLPEIVKAFARPMLRRVAVRIRSGPNAGFRWSLATSGRGYGRGTFEPARMALLEALIRPGDTVWDVGAHKGYVTLFASRRVGLRGKVYAFEPAPENLRFLHQHMTWNAIQNAVVVETALGARDGEARFGGRGSSLTGSLGAGAGRVTVARGASLVARGECAAPTFVKMDVEGAEVGALDGVMDILPGHARLLVATHSTELAETCCARLRARGFVVSESPGIARERAHGRDWVTDPDLLAIGPDAVFSGSEEAAIRRAGPWRVCGEKGTDQ